MVKLHSARASPCVEHGLSPLIGQLQFCGVRALIPNMTLLYKSTWQVTRIILWPWPQVTQHLSMALSFRGKYQGSVTLHWTICHEYEETLLVLLLLLHSWRILISSIAQALSDAQRQDWQCMRRHWGATLIPENKIFELQFSFITVLL